MLLALAALVGCGGTRHAATKATPSVAPPPERQLYGHITSITRSGDHFLLRFDPALLLSGITANAAAAAAAGQTCAPERCPPVPNDNYVLDAAHESIVFVLPRSTHGTVLVRSLAGRRIDAATLATLVGNGKAPGITLFEPLDSGVWLRVRIDRVVGFAQQYRP